MRAFLELEAVFPAIAKEMRNGRQVCHTPALALALALPRPDLTRIRGQPFLAPPFTIHCLSSPLLYNTAQREQELREAREEDQGEVRTHLKAELAFESE